MLNSSTKVNMIQSMTTTFNNISTIFNISSMTSTDWFELIESNRQELRRSRGGGGNLLSIFASSCCCAIRSFTEAYTYFWSGWLTQTSCPLQAYFNETWQYIRYIAIHQIHRGFSARLQCLQCVSNGDTAVFHFAIDIIQCFGHCSSI